MKANYSVLLKKGTLWQALLKATRRAKRAGAILPIPTEYEFVEDHGVKFLVRVLKNLARKDEERSRRELTASGQKINPFLPYEKDLFVADVSDSHVALLNKFNVVEHHLLVVTREFEDQESLLTIRDFEALASCLVEYDSLGFYNGGEAAGASQRHKHLQLVPLPLAPKGLPIPIEAIFFETERKGETGKIPALPFLNAFSRLEDLGSRDSRAEIGSIMFAAYNKMLRHIGFNAVVSDPPVRQTGPYCLLITRRWMLLVPRSREFYEGISINSLGFAGALLVRDDKQMDLLKKSGPMRALQQVSLQRKTPVVNRKK